jgi:hypothetical protein
MQFTLIDVFFFKKMTNINEGEKKSAHFCNWGANYRQTVFFNKIVC